MDRFKKTFDLLKSLIIYDPIGTGNNSHNARQDILNRKELIKRCDELIDLLLEINSSRNRYEINEFNTFLAQTIELLFHLYQKGDSDIRNAVCALFDRLTSNLIESHSNRLLAEYLKGITRASFNKALRIALKQFADICDRIRPNKLRVFTFLLFNSLPNIIADVNDELLQDSLHQSIAKIFPKLAAYATETEISKLINAYLANFNRSSSNVRRFSAISIVILCENSQKPEFYFNYVFNRSLSQISTNEIEIKEQYLVGLNIVLKHSLLKISKYLVKNDLETIDPILKNLAIYYRHSIATIKHSQNNILIGTNLEALTEFFDSMPTKTLMMFYNFCENIIENDRSASSTNQSPNLLLNVKNSTDEIRSNIENLSIDDLYEVEQFKQSRIFLSDSLNRHDSSNDADSINLVNSSIDDLSRIFFDQTSESDQKSFDERTDLDFKSENSLFIECPGSSFDSYSDYPIDDGNYSSIDFDKFNLGSLFSLEYAAKLISIKYLLKGVPGQLLMDDQVRVSIKSNSLLCLASIVSHGPQILFEEIQHPHQTQPIKDILLYLEHSDPNVRGHTAIIIGKYLQRISVYQASNDNFSSQDELVSESDKFEVNQMLDLLINLLNDQSAITLRHTIISFQYFFSQSFAFSKIRTEKIVKILENLVAFKNHRYWLIKTELLKLFVSLSFEHLKQIDSITTKSNKNRSKLSSIQCDRSMSNISILKLIIDDVLFRYLYDDDHRVRNVAISLLPQFVRNIYLNAYVFYDGSTSLLAFDSMQSKYSFRIKQPLYDGRSVSLKMFQNFIDENFSLTLISDETDLQRIRIETNLVYFVKKFFHKFQSEYDCRSKLKTTLENLLVLTKNFPPTQYLDGWMIDSANPNFDQSKLIEFLIELLSRNSWIANNLNCQNSLIELIINLLEAIFQAEASRNDPTRKMYLARLNRCTENFFYYLYKIIVIYCSINENDPKICVNFIGDLYVRTISSDFSRRNVAKFFETKDSSSSNLRKREASAYDPIFFRLYEIIRKNSHRRSNHCDQISFLNLTLSTFARTLEFITPSFIQTHLENILIYLRIIFYSNPSSITLITTRLMKIIFGINYRSMFILESERNQSYSPNKSDLSSRILNETETNYETIDPINFHNICFVIPYDKFNLVFNHHHQQQHQEHSQKKIDQIIGSNRDKLSTYASWIRKRIEEKHFLVMNSDIHYHGENDTKNEKLIQLKKFITTKIQCFEPLVIQSMKHYIQTNDTEHQSIVFDLLVQLIQFHINYSSLDSGNVFISFILKQFEYFENVIDSSGFENLIKHIFLFLNLVSRQMVSTPKIIQLCDNLIANGHQRLAINGLKIIIDYLFYSTLDSRKPLNFPDQVESDVQIETQREVILAYCFKLINHKETFDLLILILNFFKINDQNRWREVSRTIINFLNSKMKQNLIQINSIEFFNSIDSLIFSLSSDSFQIETDFFEMIFNEFYTFNFSSLGQFQLWLPKMLIYLRLIFNNLNETNLLSKIDRIKTKIKLINLNPNESADCFDQINAESIFANFLLNLLQKIMLKLENDFFAIEFVVSGLNGSFFDPEESESLVYFLRYYQLILASVFQSGFNLKLTNAAMSIIKQHSNQFSLNNEIFELRTVNGIFLKISQFYPTLLIGWLNFLYILNYDKLPRILSMCIEKFRSDKCTASNINAEIIKRSSLILLCDFLSENLDNAEFISYVIVKNLAEIVENCFETPIKEFINSIHRNSVSSGLFLQSISLRSEELLKNPIVANKILFCLKRTHQIHSKALIMFLLENYLCNPNLMIYYKCCKKAESILNDRFLSCYNLKQSRTSLSMASKETMLSGIPTKTKSLFSSSDLNNLLRILKQTSYSRLFFTITMVKNHCFNRKIVMKIEENNDAGDSIDDGERMKENLNDTVNDPLRIKRSKLPEVDKSWLMIMIKNQMSQTQTRSEEKMALNLMKDLSNQDLIDLMMEREFSIENFGLILRLTFDRENFESKSLVTSSSLQGPVSIMKIYSNFIKLLSDQYPFYQKLRFDRVPLVDEDIKLLNAENYRSEIDLFMNFLPSFNYFLINLSRLWSNIEQESPSLLTDEDIVVLIIIYCTFNYRFQNEQNYHNLLDVLVMIVNSFEDCDRSLSNNPNLNQSRLFRSLLKPENNHLQLICIDSLYYIYQFQTVRYTQSSSSAFHVLSKIIVNMNLTIAAEKLVQMFHSLEIETFGTNQNPMNKIERSIPLLEICLKRLVLRFSHSPLFNSIIYIPHCLFDVKNENIWHKMIPFEKNPLEQNSKLNLNLPIVPANLLCQIETFREFMFRVTNLGFDSKRKFEEIWMTLLGVMSECFSNIIERISSEELNEYLILTKSAIITITNLLYNSNRIHSTEIRRTKSKFEFQSNNFESIRKIIDQHCDEYDSTCEIYNRNILNRSFMYESKPIRLLANEDGKNLNDNSIRMVEIEKNLNSCEEDYIDQYSCIQFLIDFYHQQTRCCIENNNLYFPVFTEIAKSCLVISNLFVERGQFRAVFELFIELDRIAEIYEDEILNQTLCTGFCKLSKLFLASSKSSMHSQDPLSHRFDLNEEITINDDLIIQKHRKMGIEKNFKEFFLPTRIHAIEAIEFLFEYNSIKSKDLQPLLDYLIKHFNTEHVIQFLLRYDQHQRLWRKDNQRSSQSLREEYKLSYNKSFESMLRRAID
ncbi:beta-amyloid-like protein [Sarcoptes scabiei]|nr:beta-amyloid-like protein [Sarcoptes scabiei]